ncbi:MAG: hypothetical protein DRH51_08190 [Candidatus Coatesbacteria bacterium]|nr:MAG: hypothetical protein DRH51_08190 [Candidatus Coatesbacteria bacterium]
MRIFRFLGLSILIATFIISANCGEDINIWELLGGLKLPGNGVLTDVLGEGGYAYVASSEDGVFICDVTEPDKPLDISQITTDDEAVAVYKDGNYLYIADRNGGLLIYDISNITSPFRVSSDFRAEVKAEDVFVLANYAYWVGGSGFEGYLYILDVTDPANPVQMSTTRICDRLLTAIYVENTYAYIVDYDGKFYVVDVSSPENPTLVAQVDETGEFQNSMGLDVEKAGNYIYLSDWGSGLYIIDVSKPDSPTIKQFVVFDDSVYDCSVLESYAFVAVSYGGLVRLDINNPLAPFQDGPPIIPQSSSIVGVDVDSDYAYFIDTAMRYLYTVRIR